MSRQMKLTLTVDGISYDSKRDKYSLRLNNAKLVDYVAESNKIIFEIDADKVTNIPKLSDIDSILDEVDTEYKKHQIDKPMTKTLDRYELAKRIEIGDINYVKQCIIDGLITDVNKPIIPQYQAVPLSLLAYAVWYGQYEITAMLVNLGADHAGTQSLWWSSSKGHYHIERLLIMSKFGGSASENITNSINKIQFQSSVCNKLVLNKLNDEWFTSLTNYMCYIIKERKAFSDDLLMMSWFFVCKIHSNPLESDLWKCLIKACQEIIESKSKNDWFWLKQYVLKSGIWLQHHPIKNNKQNDRKKKPKQFTVTTDESDIERMKMNELLFIELYNITIKQTKIEGAKLKSIESSNKLTWDKLCKYWIETKYENVVVRQDIIPNGLKALKTKQELMSQITPTYNPILFYDLEQYLPSLTSIAYNINDEFQETMQEIFKIDKLTNKSKESNLLNTTIINTHYKSGPVKLITRCKAKVANEYFTECEFPSAAHLLDINRCLLTFPDVETMLNGLELFKNAVKNKQSGCIKEIVRIKNGFASYDKNNPNYADIKLNVIIHSKNSQYALCGEIQFLFVEMSKFKLISHKLYGILRLEEEYNNLCAVMPTLLSLEREYQLCQINNDSKALNRLIVEHNKDINFFISNLYIKNVCQHNCVKILKILKQFIPNKVLNNAIESQSALRKACVAKQYEMIQYLLDNFQISMEEARISYNITLTHKIPVIIKLLEDKFGKKQLTSSISSNPSSFDNTYLYSLQTATVSIPIGLSNKKGIILWLDSTDKNTLIFDKNRVKSWQCKVNQNNELKGNNNLQNNLYPYFQSLPDLYTEGIFFDHAHTATFNIPITNMRTICSLHSYENSRDPQKLGTGGGGRTGGKENFYIFTSSSHFSFHGATSNNKICNSSWAHKHFQHGTIRLDGIDKKYKVKDCKSWEGESKIAILSLNDNITNVEFEQIGRDRIYHHFSGTVVELIVFNRELTDNEKIEIENYFIRKYYGPIINTIFKQSQQINLINYCSNYIVALLFGNHILAKIIQR